MPPGSPYLSPPDQRRLLPRGWKAGEVPQRQRPSLSAQQERRRGGPGRHGFFFFLFGKRPGLEDWKVEARPCETESAAIKPANQSVLLLTESGLKNDFLSDRDFESLVGIRTFP